MYSVGGVDNGNHDVGHGGQPQFIYRHRWRVGDVVMWDNCQSLHFAVGDYELPQRRLLYRTTIEGGIPF